MAERYRAGLAWGRQSLQEFWKQFWLVVQVAPVFAAAAVLVVAGVASVALIFLVVGGVAVSAASALGRAMDYQVTENIRHSPEGGYYDESPAHMPHYKPPRALPPPS